jgi:hypothetical protein
VQPLRSRDCILWADKYRNTPGCRWRGVDFPRAGLSARGDSTWRERTQCQLSSSPHQLLPAYPPQREFFDYCIYDIDVPERPVRDKEMWFRRIFGRTSDWSNTVVRSWNVSFSLKRLLNLKWNCSLDRFWFPFSENPIITQKTNISARRCIWRYRFQPEFEIVKFQTRSWSLSFSLLREIDTSNGFLTSNSFR